MHDDTDKGSFLIWLRLTGETARFAREYVEDTGISRVDLGRLAFNELRRKHAADKRVA